MDRKGIWIASALFLTLASSSGGKADGILEGWITVIEPSPSHKVKKSRIVKAKRSASSTKSHALDGIASYYWQDVYTASGELFNKRAMTAAHPTLPFGTIVEVTNLGNGRSARVRINDRGPFVQGRVIDVSEAAAEVLDMRNRGLAPVRLNIVTASAETR